jgi:hypothetical protein
MGVRVMRFMFFGFKFPASVFKCHRHHLHPTSLARILEEWLLAAYGLDAFLTIFSKPLTPA